MNAEIQKLEAMDYEILTTIEEGFRPDPLKSVALIATSNQKIVGRMFLVSPWHIEGTWIHPSFRGGTLLLRLIKRMEEEARKLGLKQVFSYAEDPVVELYLVRLGYVRTQLTIWSKDI